MANTNDGKTNRWVIGVGLTLFIALMGTFLSLVSYAAGESNSALTAAQEANRTAEKVAADLSVHAARQNGEYGSIQSQLGTLRGYHSTLRGEMKDQRAERGEEIKELREMVNELLRQSYSDHASPP